MISAAPLWTSEKMAAETDKLYTDLTGKKIRDLLVVNKVRNEQNVAS